MPTKSLENSFLRLPIYKRVGNLASEVNRISLQVLRDDHVDTGITWVNQSLKIIPWTAPHLEPKNTIELQELEKLLSSWKENWSSILLDQSERQKVQTQARAWAEKLLGWMEELQEE